MNKLPQHSQELLFKYFLGGIDYSEFKASVIQDRSFKTYLGNGLYQELTSGFDDEILFFASIKEQIKPYVNWGNYEVTKLKHALNLLNQPNTLEKGLEACYTLYCEGYDFLEVIGNTGDEKAICKRFDYCEWVDLPQAKKEAVRKKIYPTIQETTSKVIQWLDGGLIRPTGRKNRYAKMDYIDLRAYEGKLSLLSQSKKNIYVHSKLAIRSAKKQFNEVINTLKHGSELLKDGVVD